MRLTSAGRGVLYVGSGLMLGLAVGALLVNTAEAASYAPLWAIVFAAMLGVVVLAMREKTPAPETPRAAPTPVAARAAPARPAPVGDVAIALLEVPAGYPHVLGEQDAIRVKVTFGRHEGAAVRLGAARKDGPRSWSGEGLTGSDGAVTFVVPPQPRGELVLSAEASLDDDAGSATLAVTIVRYADEIERLFGEFRAYAGSVLPDAQSATARELAERLRSGANAETAKALLELARIYELVAYGERDADRRLYLALMGELLHLQHAELPGAAR